MVRRHPAGHTRTGNCENTVGCSCSSCSGLFFSLFRGLGENRGVFGCVVERVFVWVWVCPEVWTEIEICLLWFFEGNGMSVCPA